MGKSNSEFILGLNCYGHEASAAILVDGQLVALAEEERFNREKHTSVYPKNSIDFCLKQAGITVDDLDEVAFFVNPYVWLSTHIQSGLSHLPGSLNLLRGGNSGYPISERISGMLSLKRTICKSHGSVSPKFQVEYVDHHMAHAASAYYVSGYESAAVLTIDGWGDRATTMISVARGNYLEKLMEVAYPHSLGGLYSTVTEYLGFRANSDEYKVMGMAAYGKPEYYEFFKEMIHFESDGSFRLDLRYLSYHTHGQRRWYSDQMVAALGPARQRHDSLDQRHKDIAASLQLVTEEAVLELAKSAKRLTGESKLCYAGGVALNCLANRRILRETEFSDLFVQPVSNDAGTSLGSALLRHFQRNPDAKRDFVWKHNYWGPEFSDAECRSALETSGLKFKAVDDVAKYTAKRIADGNVIGWFQGRMEAGPRALGNRSLLADPRRADMKDLLNLRVKKREEFRPFAPSILEERATEFFDLAGGDSPYMIMIGYVHPEKRSVIPAITHVDNTARVHTVSKSTNPKYWQLIYEMGELTGVPILLNTSFNENEPIVATPTEAIACFQRTRIDTLVLGNFVVERSEQ